MTEKEFQQFGETTPSYMLLLSDESEHLKAAATLLLQMSPERHHNFLRHAADAWEQASKKRLTEEEVDRMMEAVWDYHRDFGDEPLDEEGVS